MEFHISRTFRDRYGANKLLFNYVGNVFFGNIAESRELANRVNQIRGASAGPDQVIHAGSLFAMGLIDELNHVLIARYRETLDSRLLPEALQWFSLQIGRIGVNTLLSEFTQQFPNMAVYNGQQTVEEWLAGSSEGMPNREAAFEEILMLWLANINPAFTPFKEFFDDRELEQHTAYKKVTARLDEYFAGRPLFAPEVGTLLDALRAPMLASPDSLSGQLAYIRDHWVKYLGKELREVILAMDILKEEDIAIWMRFHPPSEAAQHPGAQSGWGAEGFEGDEFIGFGHEGRRLRGRASQEPIVHEYEAFSPDQAWMPTVVLIAKSTYVWLEQLSKKYQRHIHRLDQIPDEELKVLADRGLNGLWLIGLWERSKASQTIKRLRGQADAVASAYSVADYHIAADLGGDPAYRHLRDQAAARGIRLASDMVPNHMGIDSRWVMEHPEWFLSRPSSPFPAYKFEGPDLSSDSRIEIKIEDHYYDQTDAAVVFRRRERNTGHTSFIYHGNDGTTFAWNDTAQLNYSKAEVREQVMQTILQVARLFPIIRFDAAMTLAKKHVQRLWFPLPGAGGSIPSRAEDSMTNEEFDALMPNEFWREVVDRVAVEVPGTLLLAEAFWLLEGYFVRTLGMHRVYNSAFMNMLRDEENAKYRSYLKKTIEFDPDILKRYVNFMSNPDERTAIDQFGSGDRYFGVCTLLATLPGLPMFGHGQIEAFQEKYGMEYKRARMDEFPNEDLVARHNREIAPLLKNRRLFAGSGSFFLYDFWTEEGTVDENIFAYSNCCFSSQSEHERAIVFFNNRYGSRRGTIHGSAESMDKASGNLRSKRLSDALNLISDDAIVVAYHDSVTGLEYLRRSRDIDHHGLTVELRAYQYVVLQNWRELRSTAEQPWDRLCDALNEAGVHNLEEALSKLRLQPLHEALRQLLSPGVIQHVIGLAEEDRNKLDDDPRSGIPAPDIPLMGKEGAVESKGTAEPLQRSSPDLITPVGRIEHTDRVDQLDPETPEEERFGFLFEKIHTFFQVLETLECASYANRGEVCQRQIALSVQGATCLPRSMKGLATSVMQGAGAVLPLEGMSHASTAVWAPILAWSFLSCMNIEADLNVAFFDQLHLRSALAEIFSSLGLEGESAWRAAARVRLLLSLRTNGDADSVEASLRSSQFWKDPDVRWLAGASEFEGKTFFNKELLEELASWLFLPDLISAGVLSEPFDSERRLLDINRSLHRVEVAAQAAMYEIPKFIGLLQPSMTPGKTEAKRMPDQDVVGVKASASPHKTPS